MKRLICDKLAAAAEDIVEVFQHTTAEYECELDRHRKLLALAWKPVVKLHRTELLQQLVYKRDPTEGDRLSLDQDTGFALHREELQFPQSGEEPGERSSSELGLKREPGDLWLNADKRGESRSGDEAADWDLEEADPELQQLSSQPAVPHRQEEDEDSSRPSGTQSVGTQVDVVWPCFPQDFSESGLKQEPQDLQLCFAEESRTGVESSTVAWDLEEPSRESGPTVTGHSHTAQGLHSGQEHSNSFSHGTRLLEWEIHVNEGPHICETCGRYFTRKSSLTRHKLIHTGERPHACNTCGKSFLHKFYLKAHKMTHTGEKPHVCPMCLRGFSSSFTLNCHIKIHTGERPHVCATCGKGFIQRTQLIAHQTTHAAQEP